jgi:YVTN family beta-propeller protein
MAHGALRWSDRRLPSAAQATQGIGSRLKKIARSRNKRRLPATWHGPVCAVGLASLVGILGGTFGQASASVRNDASERTATCPNAAQLRNLGYFSTTDGSEHVIDARTGSLVATIPGFRFPSNTYVIPNGQKVFVDNWGTDQVLVVNACTRKIAGSIQLPGKMLGSLNPSGTRLYETLLPTGLQESGAGQVFVIDTATDKIIDTISTPVKPVASVVSPDGRVLYVATLNSVVPIDASTGAELSPPMPIPGVPGWLAITPDGSKIYTANIPSGISVIDTKDDSVTKTIPTAAESAPQYDAVSPDGRWVWATFAGGGTGIISVASDAVVHTLPSQGMSMTVSFLGSKAYIGEGGPNTRRANGVQAIVDSASGKWNPGPGNLTIYDAANFKLIKRLDRVGEFPGVVGFAQG